MKMGRRDIIYTLVLGEIVGIFAYVILRVQEASVPVPPALLFGGLFVGIPIGGLAAVWVTFRLAQKNPIFAQMGKYAAVGAGNTAVDFGVFNILIAVFPRIVGNSVVFALWKAFAFIVATIHSYAWNKFWTFEQKSKEEMGSEFVSFFFYSGIGIGINVGIATGIEAIGPESKFWAGIMAPAIATLASLVWNFVAYRYIVFKKSE